MPKKAKTIKSSTKISDKDDGPKATYAELILQDPNFYVGTSKFEFPNGDKYEGEYCAHLSGMVWRQGKGTYTTKDDQIYVGEWDGDKLVENSDVEITYPDGTKYLGTLVKSKYSGSGIYQLEEKVSLTCSFLENKPSGEITLIDPNGKAWHGFAEKDESLLIQEHPFYRSIGKDLGKGRCKHIKPVQQQDSKTSMKSSSKKSDGSSKYELEKEAFAKSKKTPSNLKLDDSEWYRDYVNYCDAYGGIIHKVQTAGENLLGQQEHNWYKKYKEFERIYTATLRDHKMKRKMLKSPVIDSRIFQYIHSAEYRAQNKPVPVFYPRDAADVEEDDCESMCQCE